jgi:hypothetical protein
VISGSIKVNVAGDSTNHILTSGRTLVCEREDNSAPTDLSMTPIGSTQDLSSGDDLTSVVLTIQLCVFKTQRSESPGLTPLLKPMTTRGRSGSLGEFHLDNHQLKAKHWESAHRYQPPIFSERYKNESEVPPPVVRDSLNIEELVCLILVTQWAR